VGSSAASATVAITPVGFLKVLPGVVPVNRNGGIAHRRTQHFGELIDVGFEALPLRIHRRVGLQQQLAVDPCDPSPVD